MILRRAVEQVGLGCSAMAWLENNGGDKKRAHSETSGGRDMQGKVCSMLHNLDARMRAQEGKVATYFLPDSDPAIVLPMIAANKAYDDKKPERGKPHEFGPRRTTLAGGCLLAISKVDLKALGAVEQQYMVWFDQIATQTGTPSVAAQLGLLKELLKTLDTAQKLEPEIAVCQFFKTKKASKYIFAIEFQPYSPFRHTYDLIRLVLSAAGGVAADGSPPRGPQIRDIPR